MALDRSAAIDDATAAAAAADAARLQAAIASVRAADAEAQRLADEQAQAAFFAAAASEAEALASGGGSVSTAGDASGGAVGVSPGTGVGAGAGGIKPLKPTSTKGLEADAREAEGRERGVRRQAAGKRRLASHLRVLAGHNEAVAATVAAHAELSRTAVAMESSAATAAASSSSPAAAAAVGSLEGSVATAAHPLGLVRFSVKVPKALAVVSYHPFLDVFKRFLAELLRVSVANGSLPIASGASGAFGGGNDGHRGGGRHGTTGGALALWGHAAVGAAVAARLPVERLVANFVLEVPLPPPASRRANVAVRCALPAWAYKRLGAVHAVARFEALQLASEAAAAEASAALAAAGGAVVPGALVGLQSPPDKMASGAVVVRAKAARKKADRAGAVAAKAEVAWKEAAPVLELRRSAGNELPAVGVSLRPLLSLLRTEHILAVFECLLFEAKVCLVSRRVSLLAPVAEAFSALLFPLAWVSTYIPVMPGAMATVLEAPMPFFVGVHPDALLEAFGGGGGGDSEGEKEDKFRYLGVRRPREVRVGTVFALWQMTQTWNQPFFPRALTLTRAYATTTKHYHQ